MNLVDTPPEAPHEASPPARKGDVQTHRLSVNEIHQPDLCHPVFKGIWKNWIVEIQNTLRDVDDSSVSDWESGFRSDWNAEAEIILWVGIARTFVRFSEDKDQAWKIELYRFLLAVTVQDLSEAPDVLESALKRFGRRRIGHILTRLQQERRIACRQAEEKQELKASPSLFDLPLDFTINSNR